MKIAGLQKVSTIDYPGEICCVVFLWGCNFRCGFCYNRDLVLKESEGEFSSEEVLDFLSNRMGKLDAVCITGGEPLLSLDFDFVRRIKSMGFKVKLDTNGSFPGKLKELIDEELIDYVAMDVKGTKEDYASIVNVDVDVSAIEESIRLVNDFGGEFRTTYVPGLHDASKMKEMGKWMGEVCDEKPKVIFLQGFKRVASMINPEFLAKREVLERELLEVRGEIKDLFVQIGVRS